MSDCCDGINDLGCVGFCDTVETGVTAAATATYIISVVGSGNYLEVAGTLGSEITFTNPFNEDSVTIFKILRNGVEVTLNDKNCFQVKVNPAIDLT